MMNEDLIVCSFDDQADLVTAGIVHEGLGESNNRAAPIHLVKSLACFAKCLPDIVVGGALGRTWGECCELQQLWVTEEYRRRGIGTRLLKLFEERAYARGCRAFYLETFSFQSPEFYRSLGYEIKLEITGFPGGISKYVMVKHLQ
jgi:GNAT superfamily N-acetyltransferase